MIRYYVERSDASDTFGEAIVMDRSDGADGDPIAQVRDMYHAEKIAAALNNWFPCEGLGK